MIIFSYKTRSISRFNTAYTVHKITPTLNLSLIAQIIISRFLVYEMRHFLLSILNCQSFHRPGNTVSLDVRKPTFGHAHPAKIQISLRIRAVWSESSMCIILDSEWCQVSSCGQRRLWSDCADAQADLSLRWAHMSEGTFSIIETHSYYAYRSVYALLINLDRLVTERLGLSFVGHLHKGPYFCLVLNTLY